MDLKISKYTDLSLSSSTKKNAVPGFDKKHLCGETDGDGACAQGDAMG